MAGINRVSGKRGHDDNVLVNRVFEDSSCVVCTGPVSNTVFYIFRGIPVLDSESGRPAFFDDLCFGYLLPTSMLIDFEPDNPVLAGL